MSDLDEIVDIQIAVSDVVASASSGGGGGGGGGGGTPNTPGVINVNTPTGVIQDDTSTGKIEVGV